MMDIIENNPYRCLGVFSNSPTKERVANQGKIKAFLKVGKEVTFPLDLPHVLPTIARTVENVSEAESKLTLPIDQVKYAQFWWLKVTPLDEVAFNHLQAGNLPMAQSIWEKKETVSSLQNRLVLALIQSDYSAAVRYAEILYTRYVTEFLSLVVGQTALCTAEEMGHTFLDTLLDSGVTSAKLLSYISLKEWSTYVGEKTISPLIDKISQAIADAKASKGKGSKARYNAGVKLSKDTKESLSQLQKLLPTTDLRYQTIADKLGLEILQCGIDYYNDSDEDDAPQKAMKLQKYAQSIVVGYMAKQRCAENLNILKKIIDNLPPKEILTEAHAINEEFRKFSQLPDKISHAVTLLNNTKPHLDVIKSKLGASNAYYLKLSTQVVSNALHNVIEEVNNVQNDSNFQLKMISDKRGALSIIQMVLRAAWKATKIMDTFDMERDFKSNRYIKNRQSLENLCSRLDVPTTTGAAISKGYDKVNTATNGCAGYLLGYIIFGVILLIIFGIAELF